MSPEAIASRALLLRLIAEIDADRAAMARRLEDAEGVLARWAAAPPSHADLVLGAYALHAWYTALESLLERIARALDGGRPEGTAWHRELLTLASIAIDGVRPAVLPGALLGDLTGLLSFRHFFRHAYAADFDPPRLRLDLDRLLRVAPAVTGSLDAFGAFLREAAAAGG